MAFEDIECVNPPKAAGPKVPKGGVVVSARLLGSRNGVKVRYVKVQIGADLAKSVALDQAEHKVALSFGTDSDAGKVRVAVPTKGGGFTAKKDKQGNYALTINAASAEGLFSLEFPAFAVERCSASRPGNGQPSSFVFQASSDMLAVED